MKRKTKPVVEEPIEPLLPPWIIEIDRDKTGHIVTMTPERKDEG